MAGPTHPCTALEKYEPSRFQQLRVATVYLNGHVFRRAAAWRCACGMYRPRSFLCADIPPCRALPD